MSNQLILKGLISERLSEAAEEIFALVEQTLGTYRWEIERLKRGKEPGQIHVLDPEVQAEEEQRAGAVLNHDGKGLFHYKEETEPVPIILSAEPQMIITNVKSLESGVQPREHLQWDEYQKPEEHESVGDSEPEQRDPDTDDDDEEEEAPTKGFLCPACPKSFPQVKGLKMHMRMVHPGDKALYLAVCKAKLDTVNKTFCCTICQRGFEMLSSLEEHKKEHTEETMERSSECEGSLPNESSSKTHTSHDNDEEPAGSEAIMKAFGCPVCKKRFPQIRGLKLHMRKVHMREKALYRAVCRAYGSQSIIPGMVRHSRFDLQSSKREHTEDCSEGFTNPQHMDTLLNQQLSCKQCGEKHDSMQALLYHVCHIKQESPSPSREEQSWADLLKENGGLSGENTDTTHMETLHQNLFMNVESLNNDEFQLQEQEQTSDDEEPEDQESGAAECDDSSESESEQEDPDVDSDGEVFSCAACNKQFPQIRGLRMHMTMVHSGEKPRHLAKRKGRLNNKKRSNALRCRICNKHFVQKFRLKLHLRKHGENDPFKCTTCGVTFITEAQFAWHMKSIHSIEKPFVCLVCGYSSKTAQSQRAHKIVHTDDRPFKCSVCWKSFRTKRNVQQHMNTHMENKPFHCAPCDKRFSTNQGLTVHRKLYHL